MTKQSGKWTLVPEGETSYKDGKLIAKRPEGSWYPVEDNYELVTKGRVPVRWSSEKLDGFEYLE